MTSRAHGLEGLILLRWQCYLVTHRLTAISIRNGKIDPKMFMELQGAPNS